MSNHQPPNIFPDVSSTAMRYLQCLEPFYDPYKTQVISRNISETKRINQFEEPSYVTEVVDGQPSEVSYTVNNQTCGRFRIEEGTNDFTMFTNDEITNDDTNHFNPSVPWAMSGVSPLSTHDFFRSPVKKRKLEDDASITTFFNPDIEDFNVIENDKEMQSTAVLFGANITSLPSCFQEQPKPQDVFDTLLPDTNHFKFEYSTEVEELDQELCHGYPENSESSGISESLEQSDPFIDESLIPEKLRNKFYENSVMQGKKVTVDTSYSTSYPMQTDKNVIDDFYKAQKLEDWNVKDGDYAALAAKIMEPSLDYLHVKLGLPMTLHFGQREQEIGGDEDSSFEEINESLQEIEDSFKIPTRNFNTSSQNEVSNEKQSDDLETSKIMSILEGALKSKRHCDVKAPSPLSDEVRCERIAQGLARLSQSLGKGNQEPEEVMDEPKFHFSNCDQNDFMFSLVDSAQAGPFGTAGDTEIQEFHDLIHEEHLTGDLNVAALVQELQSQRASAAFGILSQQNPNLMEARRSAILQQIENIFVALLESVEKQKPMVLKIRTIKNWSDCEMNTNNVLSQKVTAITTKSISFNNKASERTFTVTVAIMCEIYKMLARNLTCTKRELYYRDVELFRNQESVNKAVDTLCAMLNVQECELNVMSSSKGLIAGDLIISIDDEIIDCTTSRAVPSNPSAITSLESTADYVLIVEKDTVFQRLVNDDIFGRINKKIVLITAKGYPDVNTRTLLKRMSRDLAIPMYIIVDADPHGIEIMCTYKYGSLMKVHNSEHLAVPSIEWIGIHPSDIERLDVTHVDLTPADLKKVDELLERPYTNQMLRRELNCLKSHRLKAEIESVIHFSIDYLINDYIPRKIRLAGMPAIP